MFSCHQLNLCQSLVAGTNLKLMLLRDLNLCLLQLRSIGASPVKTIFKLKSFSVGFVTLISIKFVTSGVRCPLFILAFLVMKLLVVSHGGAVQLPNLNPVISLQAAAG